MVVPQASIIVGKLEFTPDNQLFVVVPQASTVAWELGDTPKDTQILWLYPKQAL